MRLRFSSSKPIRQPLPEAKQADQVLVASSRYGHGAAVARLVLLLRGDSMNGIASFA